MLNVDDKETPGSIQDRTVQCWRKGGRAERRTVGAGREQEQRGQSLVNTHEDLRCPSGGAFSVSL